MATSPLRFSIEVGHSRHVRPASQTGRSANKRITSTLEEQILSSWKPVKSLRLNEAKVPVSTTVDDADAF